MAKTAKRGLIGKEDLSIGTSTFSRTTSTGGSQTITQFPVGCIPIVATASLPVAGAAMDGTIIIENVGAGDRNIVFYANGQRFRIDGGTNF